MPALVLLVQFGHFFLRKKKCPNFCHNLVQIFYFKSFFLKITHSRGTFWLGGAHSINECWNVWFAQALFSSTIVCGCIPKHLIRDKPWSDVTEEDRVFTFTDRNTFLARQKKNKLHVDCLNYMRIVPLWTSIVLRTQWTCVPHSIETVQILIDGHG